MDSLVHHAVLEHIVRAGHAPTLDELARALSASREDIERSLQRLAEGHGLVIRPGSSEVVVAHPFAVRPTATWVDAGTHGWWAPCLWCAFGIATLVACEVSIHARLAGEREPMTLHVFPNEIVNSDLLVHFSLPPRSAWDDVALFCSTVLPFRSRAQCKAWCGRHRLPYGELVPMAQVQDLATAWYGRHLDRDWVKWTAVQAQEIFREVGLTSAFWELAPKAGERF
ncbi:MAG: organomercurial lyase [Polyangiaceae bacterium]